LAIAAAEIAKIADGFESGPPIAKRKELRNERVRSVAQLPMMAVQTPRFTEEAREPPKIRVANELA